MAVEKFRFVSPGVQINEIDDSIVTPQPPAVGPVIIGNTARGPAMEPVLVSSVAELEKVFGAPSNGNVAGVDVWRSGAPTAPTLATYAAKAFLQNSSPVTVIRLAGVPTGSSDTTEPGWEVGKVWEIYAATGSTGEVTGSLVAKIYADGATTVDLDGSVDGFVSAVDGGATLVIDGTNITFNLNPKSNKFIRSVLNTNPSRYLTEDYFLGETFENSTGSVAGFDQFFITGSDNVERYSAAGALAAKSGMVVSQLAAGNYNELFYFESLEKGSATSSKFKISIENVRASRNTNVTKYGSFDVVVRSMTGNDSNNVLERFSNLSLDQASDNYIAKRIGDASRRWDLPCGFRMANLNVPTITDLDLVSMPDIETVQELSSSLAKSKRFGLVVNDDTSDVIRYAGSGARDFDGGPLCHMDYVATVDNMFVYEQGTENEESLLLSGSFSGFDMPLYDGFDAKDITRKEAFVSNARLSSGNETNNAAYRAINQAINMTAVAEFMDMNTLCIPGLQNKALVSKMVEVCKTRGDAMAIIDLDGDYEYPHDTDGAEVKPTSVTQVVDTVTSLNLDNSYGAAYFPAVFVPSEGIYMPASLAAIGAIGGTEGRSALWFAPAGFNRGGLSQNNSGIGVSKTALHLVSSDRDTLYENNINPIATFPNEGVVIFGQKTLQATPSALDRVNVRRLVNFIKKEISRAATRVLFQPNVEATWDSFKAVVEPFLLSIKNGYGLDDAKIVLDETTTTADLVDRNIMYCKVFIKPTRAIEFIAIDFVVTNAGASFSEA